MKNLLKRIRAAKAKLTRKHRQIATIAITSAALLLCFQNCGGYQAVNSPGNYTSASVGPETPATATPAPTAATPTATPSSAVAPSPTPLATPAPTATPAPVPTATPTPAPTATPVAVAANFVSFGHGAFALTPGQKQVIGSGVSLQFTTTGDLQVVNAANQILWHTNTSATCATNCSATFQGDGNLVIYGPNGALWSSQTYNVYGSLTLSPTAAYLTIRDGSYNVAWTSGGTAPLAELGSALSPTHASTAQSFLNSLAINTHMDQNEGDVTILLNKLNFTGLKTIRDHYNSALVGNFKTLAQNGIHFDMLNYSNSFPTLITNAETLASYGTGALTSVEGPNEINNFSFICNGSVWSGGWPNNNGPAAQCFMTNYDQALKADTKLSGVMMYDLTGGNSARNAAQYGLLALAGQADEGNIHVYPGSGAQPGGPLLDGLAETYLSVLPSSAVITETGYSTSHQTGPVSTTAQSILITNLFLDAFAKGFRQTFIYEMTDNSGEGYGLYDTANNPKPAALVLHNLTTILADTGSRTPSTLNDSATGLPTSAQSLLLQKANGTYELIIWNEARVWNGADVNITPVPVHISLGSAASKINVYNPFLGSTALQQTSSASSVDVSLGSQAQIIEIVP